MGKPVLKVRDLVFAADQLETENSTEKERNTAGVVLRSRFRGSTISDFSEETLKRAVVYFEDRSWNDFSHFFLNLEEFRAKIAGFVAHEPGHYIALKHILTPTPTGTTSSYMKLGSLTRSRELLGPVDGIEMKALFKSQLIRNVGFQFTNAARSSFGQGEGFYLFVNEDENSEFARALAYLRRFRKLVDLLRDPNKEVQDGADLSSGGEASRAPARSGILNAKDFFGSSPLKCVRQRELKLKATVVEKIGAVVVRDLALWLESELGCELDRQHMASTNEQIGGECGIIAATAAADFVRQTSTDIAPFSVSQAAISEKQEWLKRAYAKKRRKRGLNGYWANRDTDVAHWFDGAEVSTQWHVGRSSLRYVTHHTHTQVARLVHRELRAKGPAKPSDESELEAHDICLGECVVV